MTPEKIEVQVPEEPPLSSVVVDKDGRAWQNLPNPLGYGPVSWIPVCTHYDEAEHDRSVSWTYLLAYAGPVTLVHRAEPKS